MGWGVRHLVWGVGDVGRSLIVESNLQNWTGDVMVLVRLVIIMVMHVTASALDTEGLMQSTILIEEEVQLCAMADNETSDHFAAWLELTIDRPT